MSKDRDRKVASPLCKLLLYHSKSNNYMKGGEKNGVPKTCNLGTRYCTDGTMPTE
jgi:hypothetical protein